MINRRSALSAAIASAALLPLGRVAQAAADPIRFGAGPFLPTPDDTRRQWDPLFKYLAAKLDRPYTLQATSDWAGISVALASGQVDVAFIGPYGYELAKRHGAVTPIAVMKVDGTTTYHSIVLERKGLNISKWPQDAKGMRLQLADTGSTSGWLIPTFWLKSQGIDPKTYFQYRDGTTHAANEVAIANGQTDFATDNNQIRQTLIDNGIIKADDATIVWQSDPIPNSLMAARGTLDPALIATIHTALLDITEEQASKLMPKHNTGWASTTDADYKIIDDAAISLGILKPL